MPYRKKQDGVPLGIEDVIQRQLISDIRRVKPEDANSLQFYNCVRNIVISEGLGLDEGLARARINWPYVEPPMREFYNSEPLAELLNFIPFPKSTVTAPKATLQKERTVPSSPVGIPMINKPTIKPKKTTARPPKAKRAKVHNKKRRPACKAPRKLRAKPKSRNQDTIGIRLNGSVTEIMNKLKNKRRRNIKNYQEMA